MDKVIKGSIESLEQVIDFIQELSDEIYMQIPEPLSNSSIGQHLRHILDLYMALIMSSDLQNINYDVRRRGLALETDRNEGIKELFVVCDWLKSLDLTLLNIETHISTEVSVYSEVTANFSSTVGREVCFVSTHLTHHLALMAVIAKFLGHTVSPDLGVAPTTATFLRSQK
jgi:uncharacterized damage-inducible protein DinB